MNQTRIIKYQPALNEITGSITASLLMNQLEYWFEKSHNKPFFKFLAPCEDDYYRSGDSWCEELGFSKAEFRCAFSRIGKVYTSKKSYAASKDPFEGKLYLSYYDRLKHRTYYLRNDQLIDTLLGTLKKEEPTSLESASPITEDYSKDLSQKITTRDDHAQALLTPSEQVIEIYHELCPELPKVHTITPSIRHAITNLLTTLDHSLEKVRLLFQKAHASDFLCGRLPDKKWRAHFDWITNQSKCLAILSGHYDTWTSSAQNSVPTHQMPRFNAFTRVESHNWDLDELDRLSFEHVQRLYG